MLPLGLIDRVDGRVRGYSQDEGGVMNAVKFEMKMAWQLLLFMLIHKHSTASPGTTHI
jgi:hypothetical protein